MATAGGRIEDAIRQAVAVLRRVIIVFALLIGLSAVVAIVAPRREATDDPTPRTSTAPNAEGGVLAAVRGTLPRDKVVRAKVGDLVELRVTSREADSASVAELGLTEGVSDVAPARFSFLASRPGRFDVTLLLADRSVGRVVVSR